MIRILMNERRNIFYIFLPSWAWRRLDWRVWVGTLWKYCCLHIYGNAGWPDNF